MPRHSELDRQLGVFLRKTRGKSTYRAFSKQLGIPVATLHRLENGQQSVTLATLEHIMTRLRCSITDILPAKVVKCHQKA